MTVFFTLCTRGCTGRSNRDGHCPLANVYSPGRVPSYRQSFCATMTSRGSPAYGEALAGESLCHSRAVSTGLDPSDEKSAARAHRVVEVLALRHNHDRNTVGYSATAIGKASTGFAVMLRSEAQQFVG